MEQSTNPQSIYFITDFGQKVLLLVYENKLKAESIAYFVEYNPEAGCYYHNFIAPSVLYYDAVLWHHIEQKLRERGVKMVNPPPANLRHSPSV